MAAHKVNSEHHTQRKKYDESALELYRVKQTGLLRAYVTAISRCPMLSNRGRLVHQHLL